MELQMYEAILDDQDEVSGVFAVSLVESPAIESNFIKLSKQVHMATVNEEKRLIMGAVLIPNKPIYRNDNTEYYLYFSKDTIRRASELFFIRNSHSNATLEHEQPLKGLTMVESWIVEDSEKDKSKVYGLSVPIGTWMGTMKVEDQKLWDELKDNPAKGFSIEGYFSPEPTELKKDLTPDELVEKIKKWVEQY